MNHIALEIDEVVVQTQAEQAQLEAATPAIKEAFRLFGERLDRSPFGRFTEAHKYTIEWLEIETVPLDELLSVRGAERLADELYRQLSRRTHG